MTSVQRKPELRSSDWLNNCSVLGYTSSITNDSIVLPALDLNSVQHNMYLSTPFAPLAVSKSGSRAGECVTECKFCVVHKYGAIAIIVGGVLIIIIVLIFYWKEVLGCCTGTNKPVKYSSPAYRSLDSPQFSTKSPQDAILQSIDPGSHLTPAQPVIVQQPTILPIIAPVSTQSPPTTPPPKGSPQVKTTVKADPFKLPTVDTASGNVLGPHESTGSNYFKQIMKGKKPVASISQYIMKKSKKVKDTTAKKHHHHHHHRKKKTNN